jgi:hypothetical protein
MSVGFQSLIGKGTSFSFLLGSFQQGRVLLSLFMGRGIFLGGFFIGAIFRLAKLRLTSSQQALASSMTIVFY